MDILIMSLFEDKMSKTKRSSLESRALREILAFVAVIGKVKSQNIMFCGSFLPSVDDKFNYFPCISFEVQKQLMDFNNKYFNDYFMREKIGD